MEPFEIVEEPAQQVAAVRRQLRMAELPSLFDVAFGRVAAALAASGGTISGPPFGWYHEMVGDVVDVSAGFPFDGPPPTGDDEVVVAERPGGPAAVAVHEGPYDALADTYAALGAWLDERGASGAPDMWEEYLTGPVEHPDPSEWRTRLVWPLAE